MQFTVSNIANQALQSIINRSIIFNFLREQGPASRSEISRSLKLSASAVSRVIDFLMQNEYILEAEKVKTPVGKRPTLLIINANKGNVLAIDLSQERVQIGLYDYAGRLLSKHKDFCIAGTKNEGAKLVQAVQTFLDGSKQQNMLLMEKGLSSISIGIPADLEEKTGRILSASLYEDWYEINFKTLLEDAFGIPVHAEKDVTLSVLAEKRVGSGKNKSDIVFIEVSNGVSAGIISNNRLVRGSSGSAGQIAFSVINSESYGFRYKNKGYLDKYASIQIIKERMIDNIERGQQSMVLRMAGNNIHRIEPAMVCRAALDGDELAMEVLNDIVELLSMGLINLILVMNPETLILGGYISNLPGVEQLFVNKINEHLAKAIPFNVPEVRVSALGEDVVMLGASLSAIDALVAGDFPYRLGD